MDSRSQGSWIPLTPAKSAPNKPWITIPSSRGRTAGSDGLESCSSRIHTISSSWGPGNKLRDHGSSESMAASASTDPAHCNDVSDPVQKWMTMPYGDLMAAADAAAANRVAFLTQFMFAQSNGSTNGFPIPLHCNVNSFPKEVSNKRVHDRPPPEVIEFDDGSLSYEITQEKEIGLSQGADGEHVGVSSSNIEQSFHAVSSKQLEGEKNIEMPFNDSSNQHPKTGEDSKRGNQDIDLNKLPQPQPELQPKPRRKKHRPKVVRETTGTPKPATPKPVTPKPAMKKESLSVKRKYTRKKNILDSSDVDTTPLHEIIDLESESGSNAKRCLNFDSEGLQARERRGLATPLMFACNEGMTVNRKPRWNIGMLRNQPPCPQPSRRELIQENLKLLSKKNDSVKVMGGYQEDLLHSSNALDKPLRGTKRDSNLDGEARRIETNDWNCPYFPKIHKKKRTEKAMIECTANNPLPSSSKTRMLVPQNCEVFSISNSQWLMPLEKVPAQTNNLTSQRVSKDWFNLVPFSRPSGFSNIRSNSTPEKEPACDLSQENRKYWPLDAYLKPITKKRTKKEHIHLSRPRGRPPSRARVPFEDPVDNIVWKLKHLSISGDNKIVISEIQNALVPYGHAMMVPYMGQFDFTKKHRPRAKVNLDPESNRVWRVLMGKESNDEGVDMDKEKWWEKEREIFHKRVESFIGCMHLIQGDRRFSQWKGSVVDSVVGVFLTQNVSDHLSSSAFMALAARFPNRSKENNTESSIESEMGNSDESLGSNISDVVLDHSKDKGLEVHTETEIGQQSPDSRGSTSATVTGCTSATETGDRSMEDPVTSQNSVASSQNSSEYVAQRTDQEKSSPLSSIDIEEFGYGGSSTSFMELLQMAESTSRKICSHDNGSISATERFMGLPHAPSMSHNFPGSSSKMMEMNSVDAKKEEFLLNFPSNSNIASSLDTYAPLNKLSEQPLACSPCKDSPPESSHIQDGKAAESQPRESGVEFIEDAIRTQAQIANSRVLAKETVEFVEPLKSSLTGETYTSRKISAATLKYAKKSNKAKSEEKNFDWDNLRKEACRNGTKRERSTDTMDSLDWDAVRCADVKEISGAIRERGMNNMLAERIKDFLNRLVRDHGSIDLEWLRDVPPDRAKDYLLSIWGLGLKSVECIRLLTLQHLAFPVDTNVGRICVRLGWVPLQPLPESLQLHLLEMYPMQETIQKYLWPRLCKLDQRTLYELHYQMITFGKVFCTKSKPNCNACPMKAGCKHFASAIYNERLLLPGQEEKGLVSSTVTNAFETGNTPVPTRPFVPLLEGSTLRREGTLSTNLQPIIEEPASPEPEPVEISRSEIEDDFCEDPDEIPHIKLNLEALTQNIQDYIQANNLVLQNGDMSNSLVVLTQEAASIPMPKLKNTGRLRTEHLVYELSDSHPLVEQLDQRETDDPSPYLLAIWSPGETAQSIEPPKICCDSQGMGKFCDDMTCFACNSVREARAQTVRGTLLIPCRTAMRGGFPLNGTYFQVNEMFADHESSVAPIVVPRQWLWNLPRRTVYFGTSVTTIFKGLTTEEIQYCFWKGFVCVRGFDRMTRAPRPLYARLHFTASRATQNKKAGTDAEAATVREAT